MKRLLISVVLLATLVTACGGSTATTDQAASIRTVAAGEAAVVIAEPETVLLDIRTPGEVAEARIAGSTNIDFYEADFADQIAELDRDTSYVVYCRSGNRSGQAMDIFRDLGFSSVSEIDGGIVAWAEAGLAVE